MEIIKTTLSEGYSKISNIMFELTMDDFRNGMSVKEAEDFLVKFEKGEHYEHCIGIFDAINEQKRILNKL